MGLLLLLDFLERDLPCLPDFDLDFDFVLGGLADEELELEPDSDDEDVDDDDDDDADDEVELLDEERRRDFLARRCLTSVDDW